MLLHDSGDLRRRRPEHRHHRVDIGDVDRHGNHLVAVECHVVNDVRPTEPSDRLGPLRFEPEPRSAQDWDKGIRQFYGGRVYPDGSVVRYSAAETIASVKNSRAMYLTGDDVDVERLERRIHRRFLSLEERERIHDQLANGSSMRSIARELGRAPSTISRELARNSTPQLGYLPYGAHRLASARRTRPRCRKLHTDGPLRDYVSTKLIERWSPEQVSLRLAKDFHGDASMATCTETIYQAIYTPSANALRREGRAPTRSGRTRRQPRRTEVAAPAGPCGRHGRCRGRTRLVRYP